MLDRLDFSKKFELVVKQEIKNYQDSLNFVLQSIKEIKENIKKIQDDTLEKYASLHSEHVDLKIEVQNLRDVFLAHYQSINRHVSDQMLVNNRNQDQILDIRGSVLKKLNQDSNFQLKIQNAFMEIYKIEKLVNVNHKISNDNYDDILKRMHAVIVKTKKEILEAPSEIYLVRDHLEEKLASYKVDVSGIMREILAFKKETMVLSKKIENIYTLIDRLKGGESK